MLGRTTTRDGAVELAEAVVADEALRRRLTEAVAHGAAASRRAGRQLGVTGLALRLAEDRELRAHVSRAGDELRKARRRLERRRGRRRRNAVLVVAGVAAAALAVVLAFRGRVFWSGRPAETEPSEEDQAEIVVT